MRMWPTLIIGLGGTGGMITKMVKQCFLDEYGKELPPNVMFMHIDTREDVEPEEHEIPPLPKVELILANVDETKLKVVQSDDYLNSYPEMKEWLAPPLPLLDISGGAYQVRQCGRIAFFEHRKKDGKIQSKLKKRIAKLIGDIVRKKARIQGIELESGVLDVFIINSLAGGTGSGMFFDVAGIIKNLKHNATVTLISLLPRLFEQRIDAVQSIHLAYANTYACLKEIDFYTRDPENHPWEVTYNKRTRESVRVPRAGSNNKLFDYVFLVDNTTKAKKDLIDRLHTAPLVAQFIYDSVGPTGERIRDARKTMQQHITSEQWCSSFGVSILNFPLEEVLAACENIFLGKITEISQRGDYHSTEIDKMLSDQNTGWITNKNIFDYAHWTDLLSKRKTYTPQRPRSVMAAGRSRVHSGLLRVKRTLEEEFKSDMREISKSFPIVADKIGRELQRVVKDVLIEKGVQYTRYLLGRLKTKLDIIKEELEDRQKQLSNEDGEIAKLDKQIISDLDVIKKVIASWLGIGWYRRCEANVDRVIRKLKDKMERDLELEKISCAIKLLDKMTRDKVGMVDSELQKIDSLEQKLNMLVQIFDSEKDKAFNILGFISSNEAKLIVTPKEVLTFYDKHFSQGDEKTESDRIRRDFSNWEDKNVDMIDINLRKKFRELVTSKRLYQLTIEDVPFSEDVINEAIRQALADAKPFWQSVTQEPQTLDFLITGFNKDSLQKYSSSLIDIQSHICTVRKDNSADSAARKKRKMVFITLEYGVPIADLSPFGLSTYAVEYKELNPVDNKWVHLTPAAIGFEELVPGFTQGMEEEALLQTCRDLGIVFEKKPWFSYQELVSEKGKERLKDKKISQGYQKTIEFLEKNRDLCKNFAAKVCDKLMNMPREERHRYVRNHEPSTYLDKNDFSKKHKSLYKDARSEAPIPCHSIPAYILEKIR